MTHHYVTTIPVRKRLAWAAEYAIEIAAYAVDAGLDKVRCVTAYMHQPLAPWVHRDEVYGAKRHAARAFGHVFGNGPFQVDDEE